jgi:HPt (histidine-containing phosphotransfer) domain-containing protein
MGSFRWSLFGYRRTEVDAAIAARDARFAYAQEECEARFSEAARHHDAIVAELDRELTSLSGMVIEREREISDLRDELRMAGERHERSLVSLEAVAERVDELHEQARGQATRIRMAALAEAAEVTRRAQELAARLEDESDADWVPVSLEELNRLTAELEEEEPAFGVRPAAAGNGDAAAERGPRALFDGVIEIEVGPLGDFSQLVGFEDAANQIGAARAISVKRFSDGRATLSISLDEPIDLLGELEERCPLAFSVRDAADGRVVLDIEDTGAQRAA